MKIPNKYEFLKEELRS